VHLLMSQQIRTDFRDVGLAEHRYGRDADVAFRQAVAECIRKIAQQNHSDWALRSWKGHRRRELSLLSQADRYEICSMQYAKIGCTSCGRVFIGPRRCETRICESCAQKYAARIRGRQMAIAAHLVPKGGRRLLFLTLTQKTHPRYRPQSCDARRVFRNTRKLMNHFWPRKEGCGAFAVLEVGQDWNLHVHALVYGHYVPQEDISNLWLKLTGDSRVVWIKEARGAQKYINYLLKYIAKPPKFENPKKAAQYLDLMLGVRRVRTYGIYYNYPLARKDNCPCPFCGGKLGLCSFDVGLRIPSQALFFDEAFALAKAKVN
jgi:hypothetical protein